MRIRTLLMLSVAALLSACLDDGPSPTTISLSDVQQAQIEDGQGVAQGNCAACHAIGTTGTSPYPKAPLFRTLLRRYNPETLEHELVEGMRVTHEPMPQFQFRPDGAAALVSYLKSIQLTDPGQILVEDRCSRCHAIGASGNSPYPGAQPFRMLGQRWHRKQLREALLTGIVAQHDEAEAQVPPMKLTSAEADALMTWLDRIATPGNPAPSAP
jgi:mono/diheme cytochrome c family protein